MLPSLKVNELENGPVYYLNSFFKLQPICVSDGLGEMGKIQYTLVGGKLESTSKERHKVTFVCGTTKDSATFIIYYYLRTGVPG